MLEGREGTERLASVPLGELKRKQATVQELFVPLVRMYPSATVHEIRVATKMEKPWVSSLQKRLIPSAACRDAMQPCEDSDAT